jgi:hypothetical protein
MVAISRARGPAPCVRSVAPDRARRSGPIPADRHSSSRLRTVATITESKTVIPAKAGIQYAAARGYWIPRFRGE